MPQQVIEVGIVLTLATMILGAYKYIHGVQQQCQERCEKMEDCVEGELKEMRGDFNIFSGSVLTRLEGIETNLRWLIKNNKEKG